MPERISHAQNGEDVRAWRALRHVPSPCYLEVGASDPVVDSLTSALHREGWHGFLVEADPKLAAELRAHRTGDVVVEAAAVAEPGWVRLANDAPRGRASLVAEGGQEVRGVRLADVLDEHRPEQLHFASVDVEGGERAALEGLDLSRWRPWLLCVEATRPGSREPALDWEPLVLAHDYLAVAFDGLNRWYVAAEHEELRDEAAVPYGVLDRLIDGWVPVREAQLEAQLQTAVELSSRVQRLELERDAALARERAVVNSKIWRLTAGLRRLLDANPALVRLLAGRPDQPTTPVPDLPQLDRLRAGAQARLAARGRGTR